MGFRAFLVMDNKVARQVMAENGRKQWKMVGNGFSRVLSHGHQGGQAGNGRKWLKMAENGGKWWKMDFRAFPVVAIEVTRQAMAEMVENGGKWISAGKWWKMDFRVLSAIPLLLDYFLI